MTEYALRLENGTDTAVRMRFGDALPLFPAGASAGRNGLRPDGGGEVTVVAGSMTVQVTPFTAWVGGGASGAQGGYPFVLDTTKTLTFADGDPSLSRTDTIVAQVLDNAYDGSGSTVAQLVVVQGTPGSGAPALPASCVPLRDVTVPAGASAGTGGLGASNLGSDRRTYTAALGGVLPVAGVTERDAIPSPQPGMHVYRRDTGNVEWYTGSAWRVVQDDSVEAQLTGATATTSGGTSLSGWRLDSLEMRRVGNMAQVSVSATRTGGSQTFNAADGGIADQLICKVPVGWRPVMATYGFGDWDYKGAWFGLDADGTVRLTEVAGSGASFTMANSTTLRAGFTYITE